MSATLIMENLTSLLKPVDTLRSWISFYSRLKSTETKYYLHNPHLITNGWLCYHTLYTTCIKLMHNLVLSNCNHHNDIHWNRVCSKLHHRKWHQQFRHNIIIVLCTNNLMHKIARMAGHWSVSQTTHTYIRDGIQC